jgi:FKBP-type peptidyl-prolyl cis-trans isomerase
VSSFISCNKDNESDYEKQVKIDDQKIITYLSDSIQAQKHSSGFYYQVLESNNDGKSLAQDNVVDFYYKISLLDGTVLEEIVKGKDAPARFKLLNNTIVPQGLDYGISLMRVGDKYRFFIPSYLAYGGYSSSLFPAYAIFIVEVEVAKEQSDTDINVAQLDSIDHFVKSNFKSFEKFASGLCYIDSIDGTGNKPHDGDMVTINFTRKYMDGTIIKSVDGISLYIGYNQAVQGLEEGLKQMRQGGKAVLVMPASIAFKQSLCVIPTNIRKNLLDDKMITAEVLPYSIVEYFVELKSVN